ncbi:MAG: acetyl-CoA C-acyltransferase, partial [Nitrospirae bacterium]|nr:acetyl-CoA C-acyltransferase [Nitrospirota bacterium]
MKRVAIMDGVRTPIGNFGGALRDITAHKLGEIVVRELIKSSGIDPEMIEEVIFGSVGQYSDA